jgi:hypothetical protein
MGRGKRFRATSWVVSVPACCLVLVEVRSPSLACCRRTVYSIWGVVLAFRRNSGHGGANGQLRRAEREIEAARLHCSKELMTAVG